MIMLSNRVDRTSRNQTVTWFAVLVIIAVYLLPSLAPVFRGLLALLAGVFDEASPLPRQATVAFSRSLAVAIASGFIATCFAVLAARVWHLSSSPRRRLVLFLILLPLFVPETAHALGFAGLFSDLQVSKGPGTTMLALAVFSFPFATVIVLLASNSISHSIWTASTDLGLSFRESITKVVFPMLWPAALAAFIVASLLSFNESTRTAYTSSRQMYSTYLAGAIGSGGRADIYSLAALLFLFGVVALASLSWLTSRRTA